jgi:hypothetical protein
MNLTFPVPDFRKASIGWLRAAYLVAFATLGYLYILRADLEEVRRQIRAPASDVLDRYCLITQEDPADARIAFVRKPADLESVVVLSKSCAVFLPSTASADTYERLSRVERWPPAGVTLAGSVAPWPTQPTYALDRAALEGYSLETELHRHPS